MYLQELNMVCVHSARYNSNSVCFPSTREHLIAHIVTWVNDTSNTQRVLWLSGEAGTGKSTVAHTIAYLFDGLNRLGSSYFFNRGDAELSRTDLVITTIVRDLAICEPQLRCTLSRAIADNPSLLRSKDSQAQFDKFLLGPVRELTLSGPVVIVIDALDESDLPSRSRLLLLLSKRIEELPSNFRIIVTSRPERDIRNAMRDNPLILRMKMGDIPHSSTRHDIDIYIRTMLEPYKDDFQTSSEDFNITCGALVNGAEHLFEWAATSCRVITGWESTGMSLKERLDIVLSPSSQTSDLGTLDALYTRVLEATFRDHPVVMARFRRVMAHIFAAMEPLSVNMFDHLLSSCGSINTNEIQLIVGPLASLLNNVDELDKPIRPLHTSFRDFILDGSRSSRFHVNPGKTEHEAFATGTINVLNHSLHFNMCEWENSHLLFRDCQYPDLDRRIRNHIPPGLIYAACFWAGHLGLIGFDPVITVNAEHFLENKALFWLELLSLTSCLKYAIPALSQLRTWLTCVR
jgi:hypothetical protein